MGSGEYAELDGPRWRLQSRARARTAESSLSTGGFAAWTDVPPVGTFDHQLADQTRYGRMHFPGLPGHAREADLSAGGKRVVPERIPRDRAEGKRIFTATASHSSEARQRRGGLRRVHPPGPPATANPNYRHDVSLRPKPQGVRISGGGRNDVKYQCWRPEQLQSAFGGDWNLNTRYGVRKVTTLPNGVPKRAMETPVAWPSYAGYPPDRDPRTNKPVDYALSIHGGFFKEMKAKHPDVLRSHNNRLAASNPPASYSAYRHAGERYY